MIENNQVFKCLTCGATVEVVGAAGGTLVCCGKPMRLMRENETDGSSEKHVPVLEDNGPGVPPERLVKLGKPVLSEKPEGLGFGLAIAASLAEAHGGRLRFEATDPSGLAVTLSVPLDRTPDSKETES